MVDLQKFFQVAVLGALVWVSSAEACSVSVNETHIKNEMVAAAASEFGISLVSATKINVEEFSRAFVGEDAETHCPLRLNSQAKVTISYSPNLFTHCELSVQEVKSDSISDESAPLSTHTFNDPASSCSTRVGRITRPIRIGR